MILNPDKIRARRKEIGITQEELSKKSGLGVGTISDIENGIVTNIKEWALFSLAKTLLFDPEDLLKEEGEAHE